MCIYLGGVFFNQVVGVDEFHEIFLQRALVDAGAVAVGAAATLSDARSQSRLAGVAAAAGGGRADGAGALVAGRAARGRQGRLGTLPPTQPRRHVAHAAGRQFICEQKQFIFYFSVNLKRRK